MSSPRFWLVVQMLAVAVLAAGAGLLRPRTAHDTESYIETAQAGPREMLSSIRTVGYPLVLKTVQPVSPDYRIVPWVQLGAHFLAVFVFGIALRRFGTSPWQALAASSGLLYTILNDLSVAYLLTDSLGRTMAMATIALVFWVSAVPKHLLPWIGLALALASTYQVRPAYLFLLPLVPCLGFVLLRIRSAWAGEPFRWLRHTLLLSGVSALPYVAFCLLRWIVVGHFGLVSFAGMNLSGITIELLDHKTIENRLPESWRPFARELLVERERLGLESPLSSKGIDLYRWRRNYNPNAWDVAYPTVIRMYGDDPVLVNEKLKGISRALIVAKKGTYLRLVAYNLRDGVGRVIGRGWVLQVVGILALIAFSMRVMLFPTRPAVEATAAVSANPSIMHALILIALMFAAAKLLLVAMVEMNVPRYIFAARMFLPAVFALAIYQEIGRIAHELRSNPGRALRQDSCRV